MQFGELAEPRWDSGTRIAERYQLTELLGEGAFGTVYKAFDASTDAYVALKRLRVRSPTSLLAFKREFRSLARVIHRNLVTLFELQADGDEWFFTMEYVDGRSPWEHLHAPEGSPRPHPNAPRCPVAERRGDTTAVTTAAAVSPLYTPLPHRRFPLSRGAASAVLDRADAVGIATSTPPMRLDLSDAGPVVSRVLDPRASKPPSPVRDFTELRRVLGELAEGLSFLHAKGKLHRDVKPSNLLVETGGRVVVLDFGLIHELDRGVASAEGPTGLVGTPAYMAPEVVLQRRVTPASDWYSFGVLLHEALTGRLPFQDRMEEILCAKTVFDPPSPAELVDGVPPELDALCAALLAREPSDRPSAHAIREVLGVVDAQRDRASSNRDGVFVGRAAELEQLREALAAARGGEATVALVEGLSGMGKSALVERFSAALGPEEASLLAGRCYERESVPYKALDGIMDALTRLLARMDAAELARILPEDAAALARLFPAMHQLPGLARRGPLAAPLDDRELLRTAARALRDVLGALARRRPVVMIIDDLQWGDEDSIPLLADLLRGPGAPPLLLVGVYRSDEAETNPFLRRLLSSEGPVALAPRAVRIAVEPLGDDSAQELAASLGVGIDVGAVVREAGGCPLFIGELARLTLAGEDSSAGRLSMDDAIRARVAQLPEVARRYLETVAVAGCPLPDAVLRAAAGLATLAPKDRHLLVHDNLVRIRVAASGAEVEPWHDRIRESVVAGLGVERTRELHLGLARALEAAGIDDPALLADHHLQGGEPSRALPYFVTAGDRAVAALAFDYAAHLYGRAIQLSSAPGVELSICRADALRNAGRGSEAAREYLGAAERVDRDRALALRIQATEQFLFSGEYAAGEATIRDVLARVDLSPARNALASFGEFVWGTLRLRWRGLDFVERPSAAVPREVLQQLDILWSAAIGMSMVNLIEAQAIQKRHLLLALKTGELRRLLRALDVELAFSAAPGGRDERVSDELARRADALASRTDDAHGRAFTVMCHSAVHWQRGRWIEAYRCTGSALTDLRRGCTGASWELDTAQFVKLDALTWMGRWGVVREELSATLADAVRRGDRYIETHLRTRFGWLMRIAQDAPARAREELETSTQRWTAQGFNTVHFWELMGQIWIRLYEGRAQAALEILRKRAWPLRLSLLMESQLYRAQFVDVRARVWLAVAKEAPEGSSARRRALEAAAQDGERLFGEGMPWTQALGHAVLGAVAAARGQASRARTRWERAAAGFDAASMALHAAAVRHRLGQLLGGGAGHDIVQRAEAPFRAEGVTRPERMIVTICP
ncbi:protein kinase [Sorangium sp. So ce429]